MERVRPVGTERLEFDNRGQSHLKAFLEVFDHQVFDGRISKSGFPVVVTRKLEFIIPDQSLKGALYLFPDYCVSDAKMKTRDLSVASWTPRVKFFLTNLDEKKNKDKITGMSRFE